jgi:hypothetical protein
MLLNKINAMIISLIVCKRKCPFPVKRLHIENMSTMRCVRWVDEELTKRGILHLPAQMGHVDLLLDISAEQGYVTGLRWYVTRLEMVCYRLEMVCYKAEMVCYKAEMICYRLEMVCYKHPMVCYRRPVVC